MSADAKSVEAKINSLESSLSEATNLKLNKKFGLFDVKFTNLFNEKL